MSIKRRMIAVKAFAFASAVFVLPAGAQNQNVRVPDKKPGTYRTYQGPFDNSSTVAPGSWFFAFAMGFDTTPGAAPLPGNYITYKFLGRTGDKTFDVELTEEQFRQPPRKTLLKMYFDSETLYPLDALATQVVMAGCGSADVPKLKMIKLAGNALEAQVLLPDCLKK